MKKNNFLAFLMICISFVSLTSMTNDIPIRVIVEGGWGKGIIRSVVPTSPEVYLCGDEISITFEGNASDLFITVTGENGEIIYNNNYSGPFNGKGTQNTPGSIYKIKITHPLYGYVEGQYSL